jgi:transposase-like protein
MERPMPRYAPELCASVIDDYLHTGKSVGLIARDHAIGERDVTRIRQAAGVPPRRARVRSLPPAMAGLAETRALLRASAVGRNKRGEAERIEPDEAERIEPDDAGGVMRCPHCAVREGEESAAPAATFDRIQRLVEQELAAEEASRAELGLLPRGPGDAERCARTLAILTRTLHELARLRGGAATQGLRHDDDIPADIDEFRNELARRIVACLASGPDDGSAGGDSGPARPDGTR